MRRDCVRVELRSAGWALSNENGGRDAEPLPRAAGLLSVDLALSAQNRADIGLRAKDFG